MPLHVCERLLGQANSCLILSPTVVKETQTLMQRQYKKWPSYGRLPRGETSKAHRRGCRSMALASCCLLPSFSKRTLMASVFSVPSPVPCGAASADIRSRRRQDGDGSATVEGWRCVGLRAWPERSEEGPARTREDAAAMAIDRGRRRGRRLSC